MPKTKKDDLFELIKSLTPTEKGYFVKYAQRHQLGSRNDYLWLFTELNNQQVFDWAAIEKKMPKGMFKSGMYKAKARLYNQILKSMRAYSEDASINNQINSLLIEANFLVKKGLVVQHKKKVAEVEKLAKKYSYWRYLIPIMAAEWMVYFQGQHDRTHDDLTAKEIDILEKLKSSAKLSNLGTKLNFILAKDERERSNREKDTLIKGMETLDKINIEEVPVYVYFKILNTQFYYNYHGTLDFKKATASQERGIKYFLFNKEMVNAAPNNFLVIYHNALQGYLRSGEYQKFLALESLPDELTLHKAWLQQAKAIAAPFFICHYLRSGELETATQLVKAAEEIPKKNYKGVWNIMLEFQYLINGFYYFKIRDFANCRKSIEKLLLIEESISLWFSIIGMFLQCLCLHELNEVDLLDSTVNKMKYTILSKMPDNTLAKVYFKLIVSITQTNNYTNIQTYHRAYNDQKGLDSSSIPYLFDINILLKKDLLV